MGRIYCLLLRVMGLRSKDGVVDFIEANRLPRLSSDRLRLHHVALCHSQRRCHSRLSIPSGRGTGDGDLEQ